MEVTDIKAKYAELNSELKEALRTMQLNNKVILIRDEIRDLQCICPHNNGSFDFSATDECPYCGRKFKG